MINSVRFGKFLLTLKNNKMSAPKKAAPKKATQAPAPVIAEPIPTQAQLDAEAKKDDKQSADAAVKWSTAGSSERPAEDANLPHDAEVLKNYNQTGVDETDTGFGKLDADEGQPQQQ